MNINVVNVGHIWKGNKMGARRKILIKCKSCNGTGIVSYITKMDYKQEIEVKHRCQSCGGKGYTYLGTIDALFIEERRR